MAWTSRSRIGRSPLHLARPDADAIALLYKRLTGREMSEEGRTKLREGLIEPEP